MPEGINNSLFLFFRCARRFTVLALGEIIVDTLCDTTFPLRLCNVQMCHMESVLSLHPLLDLLICSPLLKPGHVHVFKRKFNSDILTRYVSLGKLDNRLDVSRLIKTVNNTVVVQTASFTQFSIYFQIQILIYIENHFHAAFGFIQPVPNRLHGNLCCPLIREHEDAG